MHAHGPVGGFKMGVYFQGVVQFDRNLGKQAAVINLSSWRPSIDSVQWLIWDIDQMFLDILGFNL